MRLVKFLSVSCIWIPFPSSLLSTVECGGVHYTRVFGFADMVQLPYGSCGTNARGLRPP